VVPGWPVADEVPGELVDAVRAAHERGARVVSICSGAFVLAAAGLPDGRPAATTAALGGRLDAFWEFGRDAGNLLAGVLVAGEAGAVVTEPALHARLVPLSGG
jgi:putative intracellular protease/amidase